MDKGPFTVDSRTAGSPFPIRMTLGELNDLVAPAQAVALQLIGEWLEACIEIPDP